jgi:hypothetical protein
MIRLAACPGNETTDYIGEAAKEERGNQPQTTRITTDERHFGD